MYSHADIIHAVELYIRLGKRVKATIRQLGYPTKNALRVIEAAVTSSRKQMSHARTRA